MLDSPSQKERKFWGAVFAAALFLALSAHFDTALAMYETVEGTIVNRERTYPLQSALTGACEWTVTIRPTRRNEAWESVAVSPRLYAEVADGQKVRLHIRRGALSGRVLDSTLVVYSGGETVAEKAAEILKKDTEAMKARNAELLRTEEALEKLTQSLDLDDVTNAKGQLRTKRGRN